MRKVVLASLGRMRLTDEPAPAIRQPHEVLIRVAAVGVCGSGPATAWPSIRPCRVLHATSAAPAVRLAGDALRGGRVAVLGCGPIGLSVVLAARKAGASEVCAVEPLAYRQNMARHLGASWAGAPAAAGQLAVGVSGGFDAVFECCPLAPTGRQPLSG